MQHAVWGIFIFIYICEFSLLASLCHEVQRSLTVEMLGQQTTTSALNDTRFKWSYCKYIDSFVQLWKKGRDLTNKNPRCDVIPIMHEAEKLTTVMPACQKLHNTFKGINQLERHRASTPPQKKKKIEWTHSWQSCRRLIGSVFQCYTIQIHLYIHRLSIADRAFTMLLGSNKPQ